MKYMMLLFVGLSSASLALNSVNDEIVFADVLNGKEIVRYENYLVYYNYNSTGKTPANQWGYEISVNENNYVVEAATNVRVYPGGYAISGHGTKKELLMKVQVGDIVEINHDSLEVTVRRNPVLSAAFLIEKNRNEAWRLKVIAESSFYIYHETAVINLLEEIENEYKETKELLNQGNLSDDMIKTVQDKAALVESLTLEVKYRTVKAEMLEVRALWHRPNATTISERSLPGIQEFVAKVKALGFNTIYVETFWNGYASYRSEILDTHPQVSMYYYGDNYKHDYTAALIGEAKKVGIDVFAWCHTFNAGNSIYKAAAVKDEWLVEDYQGNTLHPNVYGGSYYLDPANPEVLSFVESIYVEMAQKYDFAGIQFDYIRYYDNNYAATPIRDSGYGEYPEKKFKEAYQLEGDVRTLILDPQIRKKWNEWRADNITAAVKKFSEAIRAVKKDILISADVVANVNLARNTYMQDWPTWVSAGYIDLLCPMIYTGSTTVVTADAQTIKNRLDNLSFLATGIAPLYYGYPIEVNLEQINAANDFGGASIFASQNIIGNKDIEASLCDGIYRLPSISPLTDPALVFAAAMSDLCAYYSYYRDACGDNYDILKEKMNEIIAMKCENPADYQKIMEKLNHLSLLTAYLDNDEVQNNLKIKIHRLTDTLDIKISREMIALGYYDPKSGSRPDPELFDYPSGDSSPNPEPKKGCFRSNGIIISGLIGLLYLKRKDLFSL